MNFSNAEASLLTPIQAGTGAANVFLSAITIIIACVCHTELAHLVLVLL